MANRPLPSPEVLRQLLRYEPETGKLFWLPRGVEWFSDGTHGADAYCRTWNKRFANKEAFITVHPNGYRRANIFGHMIYAHRAAWAMHYGEWPDGVIDHINGTERDNRLTNLRNVPRSLNLRNARKPDNNSSGAVGVYWYPSLGRWRAKMQVDQQTRHIGYFDSFDAALAARRSAEAAHGFHANHGRD